MAKIYWAGQSCFEIEVSNSRDHSAVIVIDPFDEKTGPKLPNLSADIVLVSHDHHDHNYVEGVKPVRQAQGEGEPFLVQGPGEYEVKGVFIQGIPSFHDDVEGKERGRNTIYVFEAEDMRFCHMGDFGQKILTDEQLEKIDSVDVLMIPVGGEYTIDSQAAQKIIGQIEPKIVIPMHYALPKSTAKLEDVSKFLKTMGKPGMGKPGITAQDKLVVKDSTLPKEGAMEIVVLQP